MAVRPVVVGADGSGESLRAVEWAAREANRHRAPLRIVSAPALPPRLRAGHSSPGAVAAALRGISARALASAINRAEEAAPGLPVETDLLSGPPALAVAYAGTGAMMLVVGARGAGGFTALLLGSVSRYAATHATCPVVVVREEAAVVHREIAVGVRDPSDGTGALEFAFEEAALRRAEVVAVHSWHLAGHPAGPERISAEASRTLTEALVGWREKYPAVRVRQDVVQGHPARVLASYTARADLVVIGRHGGPGGVGPGIGSIHHAVLNHAGGPVAVVPSEG